jgi:hypothetical protein
MRLAATFRGTDKLKIRRPQRPFVRHWDNGQSPRAITAEAFPCHATFSSDARGAVETQVDWWLALMLSIVNRNGSGAPVMPARGH